MTIYFYSRTDQYGEFSNFDGHGIEMDGLWWRTVEHYYQAQKFNSANYRERIRKSHSAKEAANLGRSRAEQIRSDWETIKDSVMHDAVLKKF
jgi:ribA/ribD-fused uncharacterized protein